MAAKPGSKTPAKPPDAPAGDGGEYEAADFIVSTVDDLIMIARRHGLDTLVYLLDMVKMEAEEEQRLWRVRHPPRTGGNSDE
jgi:hypothetical protein